MVKSKLNTFGVWGGTGFLSIFFFIQSLSGFYQHYSGKPLLLDMDAHHSLIFNTDCMLLGALLSGIIFIRNANIIYIDTNNNSVSLKNIITRKTKMLSYDSLDGYVDDIRNWGHGYEYDVIYLVKGSKYAAKITSFSCANYDEIKNELSGLNYLGNKKFTIFDSLKAMLGLPVYHK